MKLSKEQGQQIFLAAIVGFTGIYAFFNFVFFPLLASGTAAEGTIKQLTPKINDAKKQIAQTHGLESSDPNAAAAKEIFDVMKREIPNSVAIAWFPPKMSEFFKKQGLPNNSYRPNSEVPEPDLPGYKISNWAIEIPSVEYNQLAAAIANLENEEGLMQIRNVQIDASTSDVAKQHVQLTVNTIVKQQQ